MSKTLREMRKAKSYADREYKKEYKQAGGKGKRFKNIVMTTKRGSRIIKKKK
jgi:hypothetical protein